MTAVRDHLGAIVAAYGMAIITDARRLRNLLRDLCGDQRRDIFLAVTAVEHRVPEELLGAPSFVPRGVLVSQMIRRLQQECGLSEEAAAWAVEAWVAALGISFAGGPAPEAVIVASDGSGHFRSLADAVEAVAAGTRILVRPGHYAGPVLIDRRLEIVADGAVGHVVVEGGEALVCVAGEPVSVRGLTFLGTGTGAGRAVVHLGPGRTVLDGCRVRAAAGASGSPSPDRTRRRWSAAAACRREARSASRPAGGVAERSTVHSSAARAMLG